MAENVNETTPNTDATPEAPKTPTVEELSAQLANLQAQLDKQKQAYNSASSEAANWKKQFRETQDEATRQQAERDEEMANLKAKLADFERQSVLSTHKAAFIAMGYPEDLATQKATFLADGKITEAMTVEKSFIEYHDKQLKAASVRATPAPASGFVTDSAVTAEKFKNMTLRERSELRQKDPESYNNLVKEINK